MNLAAVLSIINFLYRRRFKLKKPKSKSEEEISAASEPGEGEAFEVSAQAEVLESPEEVTPSPPSPSSSAQPSMSDEMTIEDLAREARTISEGDPVTLFTKFVSHGQGYVSSLASPLLKFNIVLPIILKNINANCHACSVKTIKYRFG